MSAGRKCKNCGSSDIEVDPGRGDAVCTNCGSVLEDSIIVAEVEFEENANGTSSTIGQFVSADSKGGATKFGASFHVGLGIESKELTLRKARHGIQHLCTQLMLNQHCIDTACNFFKMALSRNLTRGRKNTHVHAACVYLACRTEGTAHLLIDISDILQICCYELGRTYLKLSQALCINVPAMDPCLYILRFASKLEFGNKTQLVTNTALRLVQRMKRDSIHSGRRPAGLCGAALLIAARLHDFGRSIGDIIKIVKVHESTLRKRLIEFGETPSSALTLEEFMTVDLEEDQDPPSFKATRKKDKERLQKLMVEEGDTITDLQREIEMQLNKIKDPNHNPKAEKSATKQFINSSTVGTIQKILEEENVDDPGREKDRPHKELGPNIASMGLANSLEDTSNATQQTLTTVIDNELNLEDLDDVELDTYILSEEEYKKKDGLWTELNADYLEQQKVREEILRKKKEEGKPEKKRYKRPKKNRLIAPTTSAGEAIEKILQEKKISSKINYDVLKSLKSDTVKSEEYEAGLPLDAMSRTRLLSQSNSPNKRSMEHNNDTSPQKKKVKLENQVGLPTVEEPVPVIPAEPVNVVASEEDEADEDYYEEEPAADESNKEMGVLEMLMKHRDENDSEDRDYFMYEEDY